MLGISMGSEPFRDPFRTFLMKNEGKKARLNALVFSLGESAQD